MRKSRYTETQIVRILKEVEGGRQVKEICREYGISDATYYNWKAKYGGMDASDIRKLKELEDENRRLKQMYANLSLEEEALKDVVTKRSMASREERAGRLHERGTQVVYKGCLSGTGSEPYSLCISTRYREGSPCD